MLVFSFLKGSQSRKERAQRRIEQGITKQYPDTIGHHGIKGSDWIKETWIKGRIKGRIKGSDSLSSTPVNLIMPIYLRFPVATMAAGLQRPVYMFRYSGFESFATHYPI